MIATNRDHAEALRVLYATCTYQKRPLPQGRFSRIRMLVWMAKRIERTRPDRAESCLLVAAELRKECLS
jgi:hypothetical protein